MGKGGDFERDVCKILSLWWSGGRRDDIFWRSHGSGARATARRRSGKRTDGQHGDISATDPSGQPLLDFMTIEVKKGYKDASLSDIADWPMGRKRRPRDFDEWVAQAEEEHNAAGSVSWSIIHSRFNRAAMIYLPTLDYEKLKLPLPNRIIGITAPFLIHGELQIRSLVGMPLDVFIQLPTAPFLTASETW